MLQAIVASVDDGHAPGCCVYSLVVADIPCHKDLGPQARAPSISLPPCSWAYGYSGNLLIHKFVPVYKGKGKAEYILYTDRQLPYSHFLLKNPLLPMP